MYDIVSKMFVIQMTVCYSFSDIEIDVTELELQRPDTLIVECRKHSFENWNELLRSW
jgi:hypothetical protein